MWWVDSASRARNGPRFRAREPRELVTHSPSFIRVQNTHCEGKIHIAKCRIDQLRCSFTSIEMQQSSPTEETQNLLARLSQRPGVQSTLILSRDTGAIVKSSGLVTASDDDGEEAEPTEGAYLNGAEEDVQKKGAKDANTVARAVYTFFKSAGSMIEELNGVSDEAKLLRLRTKKNEIVVVPGC